MAEAEPKTVEINEQNQEGAALQKVEGEQQPGDQTKQLGSTEDGAKSGAEDGQPTPTPAELALQKKITRMDRKFQKRIDRVTKQKNAAQSKLDELQSGKPAAGAKATPPDPEAYSDDPDAYWAAFRAYEAGEDHEPPDKRKPEPAETTGKDDQPDTVPEDPDVSDAIDDIRDAIDDSPRAEQIKKVFTEPSLPVSRPMLLAIANLDDPASVAEYLGDNPQVAEKIAKMSDFNTAIAIGKLEAKAGKANATRRVTQASDPIEPERGSGVINVDQSNMSFAERESQFLNSPGRDPTEW